MVACHHQLNGHEFEQALGDGKGQGILTCCSPWGHKESDTTEQLKNNNKLDSLKDFPGPQGWTQPALGSSPPPCPVLML